MAPFLRSALVLVLPSIICTQALAIPVMSFRPGPQAAVAFSDQDIADLVRNGEAEIVSDEADMVEETPESESDLRDLIYRVNEQTFEDSAVQITVNKQNQTMVFSYLDGAGVRQTIHSLVSTAGGVLKIPDGKMNRRPYCATTPNYNGYFPRVRDGRDTMVNPHHKSGTFDATLPWAFNLTGGIYFHQTPAPKYEKQLGTAMSGGCIRLPAKYAQLVWQTIRAHGGAYVRVHGPEQSPGQLEHCRKNLLPAAVARWEYKNAVGGGVTKPRQSPAPSAQAPLQIQPQAPAPAPRSFLQNLFGQ